MILLCTLLSITDGDTFNSTCGEVRIANIDAPETRACPAEAAAATAALAALIGGELQVEALYTDRYGRIVGIVTDEGRDVGQALLSSGHVRSWQHNLKGRAIEPRPEGCG